MRPRERAGHELHGERGAGGPLRARADAEQRAEQEEQREVRRDAGEEVALR